MSFSLSGLLTGGIEGALSGNPIGALAGGIAGAMSGGTASSASSSLDPASLESALSQQSSAFTNINTLSSYAQSQPQSDNLLASLIDGDDGSQ
jgi:hypothetical protein